MYLRDTPIYQSSPLFPYTTLFRSDDAVSVPGAAYRTGGSGFCRNYQGFGRDGMKRATALLLLAGSLAGCASHSAGESPWLGSEEHTSELQSRPHLVCRLPLEKK